MEVIVNESGQSVNVRIYEGLGELPPESLVKLENVPENTNASLALKVDKVPGKQLTTNDYSDTEQEKVTAAISALANKADLVGGKVPSSQLPDLTESRYMGGWNATTNTPEISNATGSNGEFYIVDVGSTIDLGAGDVEFIAGGKAYHNGTVWEYKAPADAVASVNGQIGAVVLDKTSIGLSAVENKSSETIRSEITESDIPGEIARESEIPTQLSELLPDENNQRVSTTEKTTWNSNTSGVVSRATQTSSATLDFTGKDVIVLTNTLSANLEITGLTGLGSGTKWLVVKPATFAVTFATGLVPASQQFAGWKINDTLIITIENTGTVDTPNYFVNRWASISGEEVIAKIDSIIGTGWKTGDGLLEIYKKTTISTLRAGRVEILPEVAVEDTYYNIRDISIAVKLTTTSLDDTSTIDINFDEVGTSDTNINSEVSTNSIAQAFCILQGSVDDIYFVKPPITLNYTDGGISSVWATANGLTNDGDAVVNIRLKYEILEIPDLTIEANEPDAPSIALSMDEVGMVVTITPPEDDGGSAITGYRIEVNSNSGGYADEVASTTDLAYTIEDPVLGVNAVRVYAINAIGESVASNEVTLLLEINYDFLTNQPWANPAMPPSWSLLSGTITGDTFVDEVAEGMRFKAIADIGIANYGHGGGVSLSSTFNYLMVVPSRTDGAVYVHTGGTSGPAINSTGNNTGTVTTASWNNVRIRRSGSTSDLVIRKFVLWMIL